MQVCICLDSKRDSILVHSSSFELPSSWQKLNAQIEDSKLRRGKIEQTNLTLIEQNLYVLKAQIDLVVWFFVSWFRDNLGRISMGVEFQSF